MLLGTAGKQLSCRTAATIEKPYFAICNTLKNSLERTSNLTGVFLLVLYILIEKLKK